MQKKVFSLFDASKVSIIPITRLY